MTDEIIVDLPMPPSTNRLTRVSSTGRVFTCPKYRKWKRISDNYMLASTPVGGWPMISGRFTATIVVDREKLNGGDADNRCKALLDYAQSRRLIDNDKNLEELHITVGEIPTGVRMTLRPAHP